MGKSKLKTASEEVSALVSQANAKITELGLRDEMLYNAVSLIQDQFDLIRNIPDDKKLEYEEVKRVSLSWKQQVDMINEDYETAQKTNVGFGAAGAGLGAGVVFLGPTAAMGVATTFGVASTGTAIATLHGAAATNAALAWLGGGMAAGSAFLALAGPVGWSIAGLSVLSSAIMFLKARRSRKELEAIFLAVCRRDKASYRLAIVELDERIDRISEETTILHTAIMNIKTFGTDYNSMTEAQQYELGSYVNIMNASVQLLTNPILGLQPKYTEKDLHDFMSYTSTGRLMYSYIEQHENLFIYMANLLYKIDTDELGRKLLAKSFRKNKDFREKMGITKDDMNLKLLNTVEEALRYAYSEAK